ncbi:helix-turn-helix transcriptional regulator [Vagococcus sp. BWB3-3]|uniref:Helix-turn-helix transcriptional regulator n=1 Tax=Vagococcus allomyrinae TaxID=2794353 RepID=A0A940SZE2_9ENTE|nr:metalloregulator ArsR/SmtB family transcription factor [Vagococcus allomyrinae]MBP1044338.1 helix-turn-helix transcriptional regulator [Vagococcus allomyrinae]
MINQNTFKALANDNRLEMLRWLKKPEAYFDKPTAILHANLSTKGGVCVGDIQDKSHLSQSTVSSYLQILQDAGFLESERHGKHTYYRRNEPFIKAFSQAINQEL